jgi:hypothetical protein
MNLRTQQVADRLQVCRKTVQRYATRGLLKAERDDRGHRWFDAAEVERLRQQLTDDVEIRVPRPEPRLSQRPVRRGFDLYDDDEL